MLDFPQARGAGAIVASVHVHKALATTGALHVHTVWMHPQIYNLDKYFELSRLIELHEDTNTNGFGSRGLKSSGIITLDVRNMEFRIQFHHDRS